MNKIGKARKHNSAMLQELLGEVTPVEMEQTKLKMQIAASIEEIIRTKGWNKSQFAAKVGKNPSEITKWLSGTQNFTVDVLTEIASALGIEVTALFHQPQVQVIYQKEIALNSVAFTRVNKDRKPFKNGVGVNGAGFYSNIEGRLAYSQFYQA